MTIEQGFAIRRNVSCLAGIEVDCGPTAGGFHGCCPNGLECPQAYNIDCCPSGKNCTMELLEAPKPVCANSTWDLYLNSHDESGYFCCEHGLPGYNNSNRNVCASPGSSQNGILLPLIAAGETALPSLSAAPSTFSATATSVSPISTSATTIPARPQSSTGSSTPVGAIAGGVVGGVAGFVILALVAWLIMRRRRQSTTMNPYLAVQKADQNGVQDIYAPHQLDDTPRVYEAAGKVTYAHARELPAQSAPIELSAEQPKPT